MSKWPNSGKTPALVLEAIMDLPLGASMREVAKSIGMHTSSVNHQVSKLRKTGQLMVVKRGYNKRRVVVPIRVRLSETERDWLKVGVVTARAIVIVSRAEGVRVSSTDVAKALGWHLAVARYHLQRARVAGLIESRHGAGYTMTCRCDAEREAAGLNEKSLQAVRYIAPLNRRVSSGEIARAHDWSLACAKYHLGRAVKAGLLTVRENGRSGGYMMSAGANNINWAKSNS